MVERSEILFDYIGEFGDLDRSIVEEGFPFGELGQAFELLHCCGDAAADLGGVAGEFRAGASSSVGGGIITVGGAILERRGTGCSALAVCKEGLSLRAAGLGAGLLLLGFGEDGAELGGAVLY